MPKWAGSWDVMNKALSIVVVLGMASVASAQVVAIMIGGPLNDGAVTWTINEEPDIYSGGFQLIGVSSGPTQLEWNGAIGVTSGNATLHPADTDMGVEKGYTSHAGWAAVIESHVPPFYDCSSVTFSTYTQQAGNWFVFDLRGLTVPDTFTLEAWNASNGWTTPIGSRVVHITPEPCTLALMAFGVLALRRQQRV